MTGSFTDAQRAWFAAADGRPEWMLWGKARPKRCVPAHPLPCHMLDVAAVAARLWDAVIPMSTRHTLAELSAGTPEQQRAYLLWLVALHDYGKAGPAFQSKVAWSEAGLRTHGFDFRQTDQAYHHGVAGGAFLLRELADDRALPALIATCAHHGEFPSTADMRRCARRPAERGNDLWIGARQAVRAIVETVLGFDLHSATIPVATSEQLMVLAGFTATADWIGSMDDVFEYERPPESGEAYWPIAQERAVEAVRRAGMKPRQLSTRRSFVDLFYPHTPWPLHEKTDILAAAHQGHALYVIEAPMGEGKTEAALVLAEAAATAGQDGMFVGLPTKATANQMHGRVERFLARTERADATLTLAHGDAALFERTKSIDAIYGDKSAEVAARAWFQSKKRRLLSQFAVGTIDQALRTVMLTGHQFVGLSALAGKTVVLDEVHAFDAYTNELMVRLIEWLGAMSTTVVLLSATLPRRTREALCAAYRRGAGYPTPGLDSVPYPRISIVDAQASPPVTFDPRGAALGVELLKGERDIEQIATELIRAADAGACVGHIVNTVTRAQELFKWVQDRSTSTLLLHSRLLPDERRAREEQLERWLGPPHDNPNRPAGCVVVGTQVLEQSLDVDFDQLGSDLAPIDLLLQRMGRLHRHGERTRPQNCEAPRFTIVLPPGEYDATKEQLGELAFVYVNDEGDYIVRRTLEALSRTECVVLPSDIERLVSEVYDHLLEDITTESELLEAALTHQGATGAKKRHAEPRLVPRPGRSDLFDDLRVYLRDGEDLATVPELRAETRLGPESIDLVLLVERDGGHFIDEEDPTPVDLHAPLSSDLVARLIRRSISVSRPGLVKALRATVAPEPWQSHAMLRHRRPVFLQEGTAEVEGVVLHLDPILGLVMS